MKSIIAKNSRFFISGDVDVGGIRSSPVNGNEVNNCEVANSNSTAASQNKSNPGFQRREQF